MLAWIGRHGVVSVDQVGRRFWQKPEASRATRRRTAVLLEAGLLKRWSPLWARGPALLAATSRGLRVAGVPLRQARVVSWRVEHTLALVDLSEELLTEYAGSSWLTERELMVGGWRTSLKLRRLPDGLLVQADGRRFAVELEASRKEAERLRRIVNDYLPALAGPNALAGVVWYARPQLCAGVEHLRRAVNSHGLNWAFEVRTWEGRP
ncbi:MAG: replication-relaxation family protein [Candidatus Dormibacteraeota bacterium]|uniref:Replication-relaxation family protein n=1 Tax=Candidatus Nephthysia bennettiae TaxID=3127016 RepID=A0A934K9J6_9BACT|nr:replication-relaxation family protein [Candidatus Dormibacteraeota bacterium]MBJ7613578.1 replication-relaxation family protein [Candidatus Dormibacteraeota bacterium]